METINDPHSIKGMGLIYADDEEDEFEIDDLENSIINGVSHKKKESSIDYAAEYENEVDSFAKQFGLVDTHTPKPSAPTLSSDWGPYANPNRTNNTKSTNMFSTDADDDDDDDDDDNDDDDGNDDDDEDDGRRKQKKARTLVYNSNLVD